MPIEMRRLPLYGCMLISIVSVCNVYDSRRYYDNKHIQFDGNAVLAGSDVARNQENDRCVRFTIYHITLTKSNFPFVMKWLAFYAVDSDF